MSDLVKVKRPLLTIEQDLLQLHGMLVEKIQAGEEPSDADMQAMDAYTQEAISKRDGLGWFLTMKKAEEDAIRLKVAQLQLLLEQREKARERMETYFVSVMQAIGMDKLAGDIYTIGIRKNRPSVRLTDPEAIPSCFKKQAPPPPPTPDKDAIRKALQAGEEVPGAELVTEKYRLEVK